jgi:hypothetical protein
MPVPGVGLIEMMIMMTGIKVLSHEARNSVIIVIIIIIIIIIINVVKTILHLKTSTIGIFFLASDARPFRE